MDQRFADEINRQLRNGIGHLVSDEVKFRLPGEMERMISADISNRLVDEVCRRIKDELHLRLLDNVKCEVPAEVNRKLPGEVDRRFNDELTARFESLNGTHYESRLMALQVRMNYVEKKQDDIDDTHKKLLGIVDKQVNEEGLSITGVSIS